MCMCVWKALSVTSFRYLLSMFFAVLSFSSLLSEFQPLTYGQVITETPHSFRNVNIVRENPSSTPCQQGKTLKSYYLSFLLLQKCRHKVAAHACCGTSQQLGPDGWLTACAPGCMAALQCKLVSLPAELIEIERKKQILQKKEQGGRMGREALEAASIHLLKSVVLDCCCSQCSQSFSAGEGFQLPLSISGWLGTPQLEITSVLMLFIGQHRSCLSSLLYSLLCNHVI